MTRPPGSNADEWNLFLLEHLGPMNNGSSYVAVQIAEAIDDARADRVDENRELIYASIKRLRASHDRLLEAAKQAVNSVDGKELYDAIALLIAAINAVEEQAP